MVGDPLQRVERRVTMVVTVCPEVARSGVVPAGAAEVEEEEGPEEEEEEEEEEVVGLRFLSLDTRLFRRPFSAMGAGSRPLRMNRSASIMKHLSVGSDM